MIEDTVLDGLEYANRAWQLSLQASRNEKMSLAEKLHGYEMFSLNQMSKIVRLSPVTLSRVMRPNAGGGRFQPEALSTLMVLRRMYLLRDQPPLRLVMVALNTGTSLNCIAKLTGFPYSSLYERVTRERQTKGE